eukprot:5427731-Pleurochrysis_carterae.AAC.10
MREKQPRPTVITTWNSFLVGTGQASPPRLVGNVHTSHVHTSLAAEMRAQIMHLGGEWTPIMRFVSCLPWEKPSRAFPFVCFQMAN